MLLSSALAATLAAAACTDRDEVRVQTSFAPQPSVARTSSAAPTVAPLAPLELQKYCHSGYPLTGVYSPGRLLIKNPCVAVTGVVENTDIEHDGDRHISLGEVDGRWLNAENLARPDSSLVAEAVPDLPLPEVPVVGTRVTVIGPWVLDSETGWLEIHPVWAVLPS